MTSGAHAVTSGFFSFLAGESGSLKAQPGVGTVHTVYSAAGPVTLSIPPGGLPVGSVLTITIPASTPAAGASGLTALNPTAAVDIRSDVSPLRAVDLSLSFANVNLGGRDPSSLVVARFDNHSLAWRPLVSRVDSQNKVVQTQLRQFSIFQIMASAPASSLDILRIAPNPFVPAKGHAAMGFFNLPASARLRIFNVSGEFVRELYANAAGLASWDGTNHNGSKVSSGVYIVYVQGLGRSLTLKVAVQR